LGRFEVLLQTKGLTPTESSQQLTGWQQLAAPITEPTRRKPRA
jgi:hypothetical protein